jgi:hypothetical protein
MVTFSIATNMVPIQGRYTLVTVSSFFLFLLIKETCSLSALPPTLVAKVLSSHRILIYTSTTRFHLQLSSQKNNASLKAIANLIKALMDTRPLLQSSSARRELY